MSVISPLPFTLTNGASADASQVMANLNQIRNDVNNNGIGTTGLSLLSLSSAGNLSEFSMTIPAQSVVVGMTMGVAVAAPLGMVLGVATSNFNGTAANLSAVAQVSNITTTNLTATYSNGTLGVGATLTNAGAQATILLGTIGQSILVTGQTSTFQNGIYTITDAGSGATNWVLTRRTDFDTLAEITLGKYGIVTSFAGITITFVNNTVGPVTVGTTGITFLLLPALPGFPRFASTETNYLPGTYFASETKLYFGLGPYGAITVPTFNSASISVTIRYFAVG